jgi:hypothetical protein
MNLKEYYKELLSKALLSEGQGRLSAEPTTSAQRFALKFADRAHAQGRQMTPDERAAVARHAQNDAAAAKRAAAQAAARRAGGQSQG